MIETLLLALALAGQAAPAAPAAPEPVAVTPAQFAQAIQGVVGQTYEGGVTITRIFAEGQTVVIVLDGPPGWRTAGGSAAQISDIFMGSFCEDRDFEYFVHGNAMRVDTSEAGAALRAGPLIHACPSHSPAAHAQ
jgi:hypothetical protein